MVQFRPAAERGQYDPPVVEDFSQAMSADMQRRIALQQNANQQTEKALQQEVQNAKYTTQNDAALKSLAQFSKTAAKYVEDNAKQTVKDIQDGQDWDFMFGADNPATNLAEEVASEAADMQLSQTKETANQLDQYYGTPVGNAFYKRNAGIGKGLQNERALLINARNRYPAFLMEFRASQTPVTIAGVTKTAAQWSQSTDAAVIGALQQQARYQFIKENGLQFATKRNFTKYMMETMLSAEGNGATNILNTNIQRERKAEAEMIGGNISDSFQTVPSSQYGTVLTEGINDLVTGNTGMDQRAANAAAVGAALNGLLNPQNGVYNPAAITALGQIYLRYDQNGKPIKGTQVEDYPALGKLLRSAEEDMYRAQERQDKRGARNYLAEQLEKINAAGTPDERAQLIQETQAGLGQYGAAGQDAQRTLQSRAPSLELGADAGANERYLERAYQIDGFTPNDDFINYAEEEGLVGSEYAQKMRDRDKPKAIPAASQAAKLVKDTNKALMADSAELVGAKVVETQTGSYFKSERGQFISDSSLTNLMVGLQRQREDIAQRTYNATPGSEEDKVKAVKQALEQFDSAIEKDPNNIYNLNALRNLNLSKALSNENIEELVKGVNTAVQAGKPDEALKLIKAEPAFENMSDEEARAAYAKINQLRNLSQERIQRERKELEGSYIDVTRPVDWTKVEAEYVYEDGKKKLTPGVARQFNLSRGDTLFTPPVTTEYIEYAKDSKNAQQPFHPDLVRFADQLGVNPRTLLIQQAEANGMAPDEYMLPSLTPVPTAIPNSTDPSIDADGNVVQVGQQVGGMGGPSLPDGMAKDQFTPYQGAQWFMREGYSVRGASYLSGNIQTEANWIPNRPPWNDVGAPAGGLASWRAERLDALQEFYGRPVQYISTEDQLKYLVHELTTNPMYKEADRIFRMENPTQRQLIRASKIFWGYGVEGDRYTNAERIYDKVKP